MADTPLPERGESCTTFLLWSKNPAVLRAGNPVHVKAQTFRRTSVQSERLCGAACPYLDQLITVEMGLRPSTSGPCYRRELAAELTEPLPPERQTGQRAPPSFSSVLGQLGDHMISEDHSNFIDLIIQIPNPELPQTSWTETGRLETDTLKVKQLTNPPDNVVYGTSVSQGQSERVPDLSRGSTENRTACCCVFCSTRDRLTLIPLASTAPRAPRGLAAFKQAALCGRWPEVQLLHKLRFTRADCSGRGPRVSPLCVRRETARRQAQWCHVVS
ncbi:hypothetical protein INR49_001797 [Caranx melampygus]|nr:hypothetical protein INR49_001797 [Caranx melampygus]